MPLRSFLAKTLFGLLAVSLLVLNVISISASAELSPNPLRSAAALAAEEIQFTSREKRYDSKSPNYVVEVRYPEITGGDAGRGAKFNIEVNNLIAKRIALFKNEVAAVGQAGAGRCTLKIDYHVTFSNGRLISVAFPTDSLLTPSDHREHLTLCLTYDLQAGAGLSMADIFKPETDFLRIMAEYCIPRLTAQLGQSSNADWIKRGASATGENYKVWNLTPGGIEITFDPDQVAGPSAGVQQVVVPFSRLRPLIATGSPVFALT